MKQTLKILAVIACAVNLITFSACSHKTDNTVSASLDSLFSGIFTSPDEPGGIVLVAQGDSIVYTRSYGMADLRREIPVCDTTLFNICSISKIYSAVALVKLQEQGLLDIDDSVTKYIPALTNPHFRNITLRHLLTHTSGIPDTRPRDEKQWHKYRRHHDSRFGSCRDYMLYALSYESTKYLADIDTFAFEPGTAYEFQNPPYQLVLRIVEDASRKRFAPWMKANLFDPIGLSETMYFDPSLDQDLFSHGYVPEDGNNKYPSWHSADNRWEESDYGECNFFPTKPDGGIFTTARDFFKWHRALMGGKIISDSSLHMATTPYIATDKPYVSTGLGFFIENRPGMPRKIFHAGNNGGYRAVEVYFPDSDVTYLIFANRPDWSYEDACSEVDAILSRYDII